MSAFPLVRNPQTDSEWARNTERRLRLLEASSRSVRVGAWTISDVDGELVATTAGRGPVDLTRVATQSPSPASVSGLHRTYVISVFGDPTGGGFTLRFRGKETAEVAYNWFDFVIVDDIHDALVALSPRYTDLDFTVTGTVVGGPWTVVVPDISPLTLGVSTLTGGTRPTVVVQRLEDIPVEEEDEEE